jgi:hypothetical protein
MAVLLKFIPNKEVPDPSNALKYQTLHGNFHLPYSVVSLVM